MSNNFWSNASVTPKRNFRFLIQLGDDVLWYGKTAKLPSISFGETEHHFLDNKYYFPGKPSWDETTFTLVDPADPDATAKMWTMLHNSGYFVKADASTPIKTISKSKATSSGIGTVTLTVLDAEGGPLETWTLNNAFIKSVSFSDLDYTNEDLREITMTVRYDWASCAIGGKTYFKAGAEGPTGS